MEEAPWRRNQGGGIMEEESCRRHPEDTQETSRRHPGDPRDTQETSRRHPPEVFPPKLKQTHL